MSDRIRVDVSDAGSGPVRLVIRGTADVAAATELRDRLLAAIPVDRDVVLAIDELEKLDGAGVQILFAAKKLMERQHRTFTVVLGDGPARHALETAGAREQLEGEEKCRN